jgi:hypothetical protein
MINNVSLVVSTSLELALIEKGNIYTLQKGKGVYFGLTWDEDNLYVFARNAVVGMGKTTIEVFEKESLKYLHSIPCPTIFDVHQAFCHENKLFIANTAKNRIEIFDLQSRTFTSFNYTDCDYDTNHINSVWIDSDLVYICEFFRNTCQSRLKVFKNGTFDLLYDIRIGKGIHNCFVENEIIYTCSSYEFSLMEYDLKTCQVISAPKVGVDEEGVGWFTRGLARGKFKFIVGLSAIADRETRYRNSQGKVHFLDEDKNVAASIHLGNRGQVNDLRLISEPDKAHNGIPW